FKEITVEWFDKYQTFIAGIIGFSGVVITIIYNSKLAREQLKRQRVSESISIRVTLIEELKLAMESYSGNIESLSDKNNYHQVAYVYTGVYDQAYKNLISKFGLLSSTEIKATMLAYQLISELPKRLRHIEHKDDSIHKNEYISIERHMFEYTAEVYDSMLTPIIKAICELEQGLKTS
ncbi:TPA: hypothetical protein ACX3GO_004492, partial [Vibrio parahaemolyticus]